MLDVRRENYDLSYLSRMAYLKGKLQAMPAISREYYKDIKLSPDAREKFIKLSDLDGEVSRGVKYTELKYSILFIECKSEYPPTDLILSVTYATGETSHGHKKINLINYREQFIFENGRYILYAKHIKELEPLSELKEIEINNDRDKKCEIIVYYKVSFVLP